MRTELLPIKIIVHALFWVMLGLLTSCQPVDQTAANCSSGQNYNTKTRSCDLLPIIVQRIPVATLNSAIIVEDSSNNFVPLSYVDADGDLADSCSIVSVENSGLMNAGDANPPLCNCVGGVCVAQLTPQPNIPLGHGQQQSQFRYSITDGDGTSDIKTVSVLIQSIDDLPVATNATTASTLAEDGQIIWTLNYTDADDNGSYLYEAATNCTIKSLSSNFSITTPCACVLGVCSVGFTGLGDYNNNNVAAVDTFSFTVTTNAVESNQVSVDLAIQQRNDAPVIGSMATQSGAEESSEILGSEIALDEGGSSDEDGQSLTLSLNTLTRSGNITAGITGTNIRVLLLNTGTMLYEDQGSLAAPVALGVVANPKIKLRYIPHFINNDVVYRSATANGDGVQIVLVAGGATSSAAVSKVVTVTLGAGATALDVVNAIAADAASAALIVAEALGTGTTVQTALAVSNLLANENGSITLKVNLQDNGTDFETPTNDNLLVTTNTLGGSSPLDYIFTLTAVDDIPINTGIVLGANPLEDTDFTAPVGYSDIDSGAVADACTLSDLVKVSGSCTCVSGVCSVTMIGDKNYAGAASFKYYVRVNGLFSVPTTVNLTIDPVNDAPVVCQYSHYTQAKECGLAGCQGNSSPLGRITPLSHISGAPVTYYEAGNAVCYQSTGNASDQAWTVLSTGYIGDHIINEKDTVIIRNIRIDEGGGDSTEDSEEIEVTSVVSSNASLIPASNIKFFFGNTQLQVDGVALDDLSGEGAGVSVDTADFNIRLTPVGGQTGSSDITVVFRDNNATLTTTSVTFKVQVDALSAQHEGWVNISAVGPRITREDQTIGSVTNNCSYSLTKCNSGNHCTGVTDPTGLVTPDENSSIYYNSLAKTCFISNGLSNTSWQALDTPCNISSTDLASTCVQGKLSHGGLLYRAKQADGAEVSLVLADVSTAETGTPRATTSIAVVGQQITATLAHDGAGTITATAADLKTAIDGEAAAALLVGIEITAGTEVQAGLSATNLVAQASCVDAGPPNAGVSAITPLSYDDYYYDSSNKVCYRVAPDSDPTDLSTSTKKWESYAATSIVSLEWNNFTVFGNGSIIGWNIYRKLGDAVAEFDYLMPLNRNAIAAGTLSYTDNVENSLSAPVPKTVYHYEVRPIIQNATSGLQLATASNEGFKTIRVTSPPANMTFIHRWIVNQAICQQMHVTALNIDDTNNFRCAYQGPGQNAVCNYSATACSGGPCSGTTNPSGSVTAAINSLYLNSATKVCFKNSDGATAWSPSTSKDDFTYTNYFDIGSDLLVDTYEAGCPFSVSPTCDTTDGTCVGVNPPSGNALAANDITAVDGAYYYQRANGKCFINNSGGGDLSSLGTVWLAVNGGHFNANYKKAEYPPLVYLAQEDAENFCEDNNGVGDKISGIIGYKTDLQQTLPSRKQQMAYSQWHPALSDSSMADLERGINLNSSSKCNASSASGFSGHYTNADFPSSLNIFTLPGTENSGIRSMATGSTQTASCVSRYGVQDVIGNVAEWAKEEMNCQGLKTCSAISSTGDFGFVNSDNPTAWSFDGSLGPCSDLTAANVCDSFMDRWFIDDEKFNAERFIIPMGLPAHGNYVNFNQTATVNPYLFEIGPTSGVTALQLHDDEFIFNTHEIFSETTGAGHFVTGGSYLSGQGAGRNFLQLLPATSVAYGYLLTKDIALKAITPITENDNYQMSISNKSHCAYTTACDTDGDGAKDNDCIGFANPASDNVTYTIGGAQVYYNFKEDTCFDTTTDDGVTWDEVIRSANSHTTAEVVDVNQNARTLYVVLQSSGGIVQTTGSVLLSALTTNPSIAAISSTNSGDLFRAVLIGDGTALQSPLSTPLKFTLTTGQSAQVDVGFRCVAPMDDTQYTQGL